VAVAIFAPAAVMIPVVVPIAETIAIPVPVAVPAVVVLETAAGAIPEALKEHSTVVVGKDPACQRRCPRTGYQ
jgi:hypothetical protein